MADARVECDEHALKAAVLRRVESRESRDDSRIVGFSEPNFVVGEKSPTLLWNQLH
jgi:hypothetical protein